MYIYIHLYIHNTLTSTDEAEGKQDHVTTAKKKKKEKKRLLSF